MGVIGFVQQLCEESPREVLGCERVLEDRGWGGTSWFLASRPLLANPSAPALPPSPTCRSFSAVGLFLGFLVKASLRKWWKFWVLVGTRAPHPQTQVSPHGGHPAGSKAGSLLQEGDRLRPRAASLSDTTVVTGWLLGH